jgi:hypothetical protein
VTGLSGTPRSSLEGVSPTLDYLRINADGSTTDLGANAPVNAGNYEVIATFAGSADYAAGSASTTFTIAQATLTVNTYSSLMPTFPNLIASHGRALPSRRRSTKGFS